MAPPVDLSVIVNFYNMRREAARTLLALSRGYQHAAQDLSYEVLCVDNGSDPPLEAGFVESFGPEFRLIRPDLPHPSPVGPMNAAAAQAKGRVLAIMIDGAHILTPGVFRQAMDAFASNPGAVLAVRQWFVGGDQRWLAVSGYTRELEDRLFAASKWPGDGYELFRFGAPIDGSPKPWLQRMAESNCLLMPAALWRELGGYDERFDEPGAGVANLDLFNRAIEAAEGPAIVLLGEGSFHQFHGGATTNVADEQKDALVRRYLTKYERLKGKPFASPDISTFVFRGAFRSTSALRWENRPAFPAPIPLTDQLRPVEFDEVFDADTRQHLQSAYAETNGDRPTHWLGDPINLYPADLVSIQDALARSRPTHVILVNTEPGLVRFVDSLLKLLDVEEPVLIRVLEEDAEPPRCRGRVATLVGKPYAKKVRAQIEERISGAERCMVLFGVHDPADFRVGQLATYSKFVSEGCYLVLLRTVLGEPWIGYARLHALDAVRELVTIDPALTIDETWERNLLTSCASGFVLRRPADAPDPTAEG